MYKHKRTVTYSEVSMDGHVDGAQIADYMQDCSCLSTEGTGHGLEDLERMHRAWILASWQIVIDKYPSYNEEIEVATWPYKFDALYGYRNFEIKDAEGNRMAVANSLWFWLDVDALRPMRLTEDVLSHYTMDPKADMTYAPRRIPYKEETVRLEPFKVPRSMIDTNQHMNNANYIRAALEYVPADFDIWQIRVEYRNQAVRDDIMIPLIYNDGAMMKIIFVNDQDDPYAVIELKARNPRA